MSIWAYKVITSGKGGFATPALLESFLNQLGTEGWEIIHFQSPPDNPLAFTGLARRPTQRDWTLDDAAAAAARSEVDKLRAEFEAKFKEGAGLAASDDKPVTVAGETTSAEDSYRKPRDTERDMDPDAQEENGEADEWDRLSSGDELPTFFEAIQPMMRRNQRGPGMSVGVDHLAKKWGLSEQDILGALKECGLAIPEDEDAAPEYVEYDGDLFWVNVNRRGERWVNTREKPRPMFRTVKANPLPEEEGAAKAGGSEPREARPEGQADEQGRSEAPKSAEPLPAGPALLDAIRPKMRHNRRGPGGSGSLSFLSRAFRCAEADLAAALGILGLTLPAAEGDKPVFVEIGGRLWWLNKDQRGGTWINEREAGSGEEPPLLAGAGQGDAASAAPAPAAPAGADAPAAGAAPASDPGSVLAAVRLLLKRTRTGAVAGETTQLAETLGKSPDEFLAALTGAGLKVPEKPREKPVFVEHAGEIFWINRNAKDQLWLNAKESKYPEEDPA